MTRGRLWTCPSHKPTILDIQVGSPHDRLAGMIVYPQIPLASCGTAEYLAICSVAVSLSEPKRRVFFSRLGWNHLLVTGGQSTGRLILFFVSEFARTNHWDVVRMVQEVSRTNQSTAQHMATQAGLLVFA